MSEKHGIKQWQVLMICSAFIISLVWMYMQFYPVITEGIINFESGFHIWETEDIVKSSLPIQLPAYLCSEGTYICDNQTGYDICIFGSDSGFHIIETGTSILTESPCILFIIKSEGNVEDRQAGDLVIQKENSLVCTRYHLNTLQGEVIYNYFLERSKKKI